MFLYLVVVVATALPDAPRSVACLSEAARSVSSLGRSGPTGFLCVAATSVSKQSNESDHNKAGASKVEEQRVK